MGVEGRKGQEWDLLDAVADAIVVVDAHGHIQFVNRHTEQLFGYARSELLGAALETLLPGASPARVGRRKNQQQFPVDVALTPLEGAPMTVVTVRDGTALRQTEAELRRSRAQLDFAPTTATVDRHGRIIQVNERWRTFARENGGDAATIEGIGLDYLAATRADSHESAAAVAHGLSETTSGRQDSFAVPYACHSSTQLRWFRLTGQRLAAEDAVVLVHTDITEAHLANARLEVQAVVAQALAEHAPFDEACRRMSQATCEQLEWDFSERWVRGEDGRLRCADTWARPGCDAGAFERATRHVALALGEGLPGRVWQSRRPEWATDFALDAALGIRTAFAVPLAADGEVLGVLVFFGRVRLAQDLALVEFLVTSGAQLCAQALSQRAEHRFRQTLDAIADLVVVKGPDSRILWANRAFRDLHGTSNEPFQDDAQVFATGKPLLVDELMKTADGRVLRFRTQKAPIFDARGQVVMTVGVSRDITEQSRLEAELHLAARMASVGTLAAGIAHEINTPIQFVNDSVHFLRDAADGFIGVLDALLEVRRRAADGVPAGELKEAIAASIATEEQADLGYLRDNFPKAFERCLDGLQRVTTIVRSMKEFAHPAQRDMAPIDLNRAIATTLTIARNEYKYVANLETDYGDIPAVTCFAHDVNQVVLNLVVNAAHAIGDVVAGTDQKGTIRVQTRQVGDDVVIAVRDTGRGIPPAIAHRIFEPFFTTKEVGKGSGQGLALAWVAVKDKHGGELSFDSTVGEGTTFRIRLPIAGKKATPLPGGTQ